MITAWIHIILLLSLLLSMPSNSYCPFYSILICTCYIYNILKPYSTTNSMANSNTHSTTHCIFLITEIQDTKIMYKTLLRKAK